MPEEKLSNLIKANLELLKEYCEMMHYTLIVLKLNEIIKDYEKLCKEF